MSVEKKLSLKELLTLGDLDIRGIAKQNERLLAIDYISKVLAVLEKAHQMKSTLKEISEVSENAKALKELEQRLGVVARSVKLSDNPERVEQLEDIKKSLNDIGYTKLDFDIDCVCKAIKSEDLQLTEKLAVETFAALNSICARINMALKPVNAIKAEGVTAEMYLTGALEHLDKEEATRKLRILAVDDVTAVLNSLVSVLSPYYEVFALKSGLQVEKFLSQVTPELFLLDIEMQGLNGFELIRVIRKFDQHRDTPIIFLTGNASFKNLKDAIAMGARDFIIKPVNQDVLLEKISKNIIRKKAY